jgi:hypothetical protein
VQSLEEETEPKTQVFVPSPRTDNAIIDDVSATLPHDTLIHDRPTQPEARAREPVVDPTPPFLLRVCIWLVSKARAIRSALRWPTLTDHLPPVPPRDSKIIGNSKGIYDANERAETMLLEIMQAPPEYVDAAIMIARATHALRKRGDNIFAEGFVAFALSRMPTDNDGTISIKHLRERLHDMPAGRSVVPVLLRLEEQGVIVLETMHDAVTSSRFIQMDDVRIRLLIVP